MTTFSPTSNKFFRFATLYWIAVLVGISLWSREWEIIRLASTKQEEDLFGLLSFCIFLAIVITAFIDIRVYTVLSLKRIILTCLPFFVCLFFLSITIELSRKSWDYEQYEAAFRAVVAGSNPYLSNRYLYPPLFADVMSFVFRIGQYLFPLLGLDKSPWIFVFYIHQSALLFFLIFTYFLSLQFAKQIGLADLKALLLVSTIYIFNVPLLRTLSYNQVNFYILASILGALVYVRRSPYLAGISIAFGGLIKLYPFVLSLPIFGMKKWRVLTGVFIGTFIIVFFETKFFQNLTLWEQFINFYLFFPIEQESSLFRNTSPMSFLRNSLDFLNMPSSVLTVLSLMTLFAILTWYVVRFFQREKIDALPETLSIDLDLFRTMGHLLDFSVLSLLIAPSAWEHHYVLAIPLAIWVFTISAKNMTWQMMIGFLLVFGLPTFNIYPFSYLRMAGLILLLILSSPTLAKRSKL